VPDVPLAWPLGAAGNIPGSAVAGFTILELIVVIAITGVTLGVVAVSWPAPNADLFVATDSDSPRAIVQAAQRAAMRSGRPFTALIDAGHGTPVLVTAFPDGRVAGADRVGVSELTGSPHDHALPTTEP
jgi:type II secretory pathway pseudopilin PulG